MTFVAIVLVWFLDDGLKTPVEVLSILDHKIKNRRKKGLHMPEFTHRQHHTHATEKFSVRFQPFLSMLHLPGGHVLVYFTKVSPILREVHSSHSTFCISFFISVILKSVRLVFIMEKNKEF